MSSPCIAKGECNGIISAGTESPRVLSIQSHVVSGYVGNKCAVFPLQALGFEVDFINSVQFSNHTGYGKWKGQVLTDADLDGLYKGLVENDLVKYSHLLTGYVGTESFLRQIREVVKKIKAKNPQCTYLCDPVLGDNGHFYVPESLIAIYQSEILPLADITTPNTFELELLSGMKVTNEEEAMIAMNKLHRMGVKIVCLSSLDSAGSELCTYISHKDEEGQRRVWKCTSNRLEGVFTGTGDLFAALLLGWSHKIGTSKLPQVLETTLSTMQTVLSRTKRKGDADKKQREPDTSFRPQELQLVQSLDVIMKPPVLKLEVKEIIEIPAQ